MASCINQLRGNRRKVTLMKRGSCKHSGNSDAAGPCLPIPNFRTKSTSFCQFKSGIIRKTKAHPKAQRSDHFFCHFPFLIFHWALLQSAYCHGNPCARRPKANDAPTTSTESPLKTDPSTRMTPHKRVLTENEWGRIHDSQLLPDLTAKVQPCASLPIHRRTTIIPSRKP